MVSDTFRTSLVFCVGWHSYGLGDAKFLCELQLVFCSVSPSALQSASFSLHQPLNLFVRLGLVTPLDEHEQQKRQAKRHHQEDAANVLSTRPKQTKERALCFCCR